MKNENNPLSDKNINDRGNKSPVEDEEIIIIGTTPAISTSFSPIGRNIVVPQANRFEPEFYITSLSKLMDETLTLLTKLFVHKL